MVQRWLASGYCVSDECHFIVLGKLYGDVEYVDERHRHRFEVRQSVGSGRAELMHSWSIWLCSCRLQRLLAPLKCFCFARVNVEVSVIRWPSNLIWIQIFPETLNHSSFQVNPELKHHFEEKGLQFVGQDVEGERMEIIELESECFLNRLPRAEYHLKALGGSCLGRLLVSSSIDVASHVLERNGCVLIHCALLCQIIVTLWECSTTQSSPPGPWNPLLRTSVSCWLRQGNSRATWPRAAVCLHGELWRLQTFRITSHLQFTVIAKNMEIQNSEQQQNTRV